MYIQGVMDYFSKHLPIVGETPDVLRGNLLLGSTLEALHDPVQFLAGVARERGPIVQVRFGGKKYLILQHPDAISHVLLEQHKRYEKPGATKLLRHFLGEGLSTSNGDLWLRQRRLMQPAFHSNRLSGVAEIIQEETTRFIDSMLQRVGDDPVDVSHELLRLTISIISRAMFSDPLEEDMELMISTLEDLAAYGSRWMRSLIRVPLSWPTPANRAFHRNCRTFDDLIWGIINRRRKPSREGMNASQDDMLAHLLSFRDARTGQPMSDSLLRDEVTTLFMAGHETTAQTLGWMLFHMASDKSIAEKVRAEQNSVLAGRAAGYEGIHELRYAQQVIHETLRMYPPIWAVVRRTLVEDDLGAMHLQPGTHVLLNIFGLHHHPVFWTDPEKFDPDRFHPDQDQYRPPFLFIPFGGGPRLCLGHQFAMLVMTIVLGRLATSLEFSVPRGYQPEVEPNITLRAKGGIRLLVKKMTPFSGVMT
jgi:cytochrome P450